MAAPRPRLRTTPAAVAATPPAPPSPPPSRATATPTTPIHRNPSRFPEKHRPQHPHGCAGAAGAAPSSGIGAVLAFHPPLFCLGS